MPRIRTIKPEFWSSPGIQHLSPWARLLYIAMWNWADDAGRGTCNLRELQAFAFPLDDPAEVCGNSAGFRALLAEVRGTFGVVFYKVDGRPYFEIPTWSKHQSRDRRATSRYPGPDDGQPWDFDPVTSDDSEYARKSTEIRGNSAEVRGDSAPGTGEQGNRGTGEQGSLSSASQRSTPRPQEPERFAEFYNAFPRHKDRKAAAKAFATAVKAGVDPDTLIAGAQRYRAETTGKDPQYVKHPKTWINQGCWNDEPDSQPRPLSTRDQRVLDAQRLRQPPTPGWSFPQLEVVSS